MSNNNNNNPSPAPPTPPPPGEDHLYKLSEEDKKAGLDAIEPLPRTRNLYIVRYRKQPIKVDLSLKDWVAKLKTESKDCDIPESALTIALKRMHLIETEKLLEVARDREAAATATSGDSTSTSSSSSGISFDSLSLSAPRKTTAEKLVELILEMGHELFVDQHGHPFIITKHKPGEAIELLDQDFVEYASGLFYDQTGEVPNGNDIKNAAHVLAYRAKKQSIDAETGETAVIRPLYVRVAWQDPLKRDTIYIDIADKKRHIIVIEKGKGFRVISQNDTEIMFRRQNRLPLPIPPKEYDADIAEQFLDLFQISKDQHAKRLMSKCMMGIRMIPGIPHPIELPHGSKGSLKSSWCETQKRMIDPATAMTLRIPENEDDFSLQGYHNYMLVYDNVKAKNVPRFFPDALCRWVYLEATEKRQHYSNMKTVAFGSSGCAIVNGINKMFEEEDVLDRSVPTEWRRLKIGQFKTKAQVEKEFQRIHPQLLAYLCDSAAKALEKYEEVEQELKDKKLLTRMADFMVWGECFARAFGYKPLDFVNAYKTNLDMQNVEIVQSSLLGKVIVNFVHYEYNQLVNARKQYGKAQPIKHNKAVGPNAVVVFEGTIDALYGYLKRTVQAPPFNVEELEKAKDWPKSTSTLSQAIRLILSNLAEGFGIDIEIVQDRTGKLTGHKNRVWVQVTKNPDVASAELFGNEDSDDGGGDGTMRLRGKGKDEGGPPPSPTGRRRGHKKVTPTTTTTTSADTVLVDKPLPPLVPLPGDSDEKFPSKESKDSKGTSDKTIMSAMVMAPSLAEVVSMETFGNLDKLHQVCHSMVCVDWEYAEDSDENNPDVYLFAYIDAYLIHNQTFIKSGVYKGAIRSMKLDDVHQAAFPTRKMGKLPGVDGTNVNDMSVEVQKAYCLRDAQLVYELMTKNNGQLLGVMQTIAEYINRDIEYVSHAR